MISKQLILNDTQELKEEIIENLNNNKKLDDLDPNQLLVIIDIALEHLKIVDELDFIIYLQDRIEDIKSGKYGLKNIRED